MEDILSSIKRIIAEEGEPAPIRARRPVRAAARPVDFDTVDDQGEEVLELNDPMPLPKPPQATPQPQAAQPAPQPRQRAAEPPAPEPIADGRAPAADAAAPIVSQRTVAAARGSLETLSRLMVKPEPGNDGTLEGLVREMLRPMLRDWLDTNLPVLVETIVEREIAKIIGAPGS